MGDGRRSGIKDRNVAGDAGIKSWKTTFAYAGASPTAAQLGISALFDGLVFYDTANSNLRVYDSGYSTFASSGGVAGTIDDILGTGSKATTNGNMEIEVTDASNYLLTLDAGGAGGCLALENNSTGDSLSIDDGGTVWCQVGLAGAKDLQISNAGFISMLDNTLIKLGTSDDFTFKFDATDLLMEAGTADIEFKLGATTNFNTIIYGGTATNLITFDTDDTALVCSFDGFDLWLKDDDKIIFGDTAGGDVIIQYDGTDFKIEPAADDDVIKWGNGTESWDQIWYGAAATDLITLDASANLMTVDDIDFNFTDNTVVSFGTGKDITVTFDATDLIVDGPAANLIIKIGATSNQDIIVYGDTATDLITFDTSAELVHFDGFDLQMKDDDIVSFGDGKDLTMTWDATQFVINTVAADKAIHIGVDDAGVDVKFFGATASAFALWDQSVDDLVFDGAAGLHLGDNNKVMFGDDAAGDIFVSWDATQLVIDATTANSAIFIGQDDLGLDLRLYGATSTSYVEWDQSADMLTFEDDTLLAFGTGDDISIKWDATNLLVEWAAQDTGIIKFGATNAGDVAIYGNTATDIATFDAGSAKLAFSGNYYLEPSSLTDPGNAGAIPVTSNFGYCVLVSAGAETRTLADPTFDGQVITLQFKTDGGDCVVTTASPMNQTGNNTLTFADVGDFWHAIGFVSTTGDGAEWREIANDGVALSTV